MTSESVSNTSIASKRKNNNEIKLQKGINLLAGCAIITGNIVGSGIFITSTGVLKDTQSPGIALVVWVMSGLVSLVGAYCYTELGTLIQTSGGDYAYINESYGPLMAFLYIYMMVFVTFPCINAIFGITVATYIIKLFFVDCAAPILAVKLISALTICKKKLFETHVPVFDTY
jgi:amino acid transporter